MGFHIKIKASLFHRKPLPLSVITGGQLWYGNTDEFVQTMLDEVGKTDFIAFDPEHVGRGFQVVWHEGERKSVLLNQPLPCSRGDLIALYAAAERIAEFWHGTIWVDDEKTSLKAFRETLDEHIAANERFIRMMAEKVLSMTDQSVEIYGAMWPLHPGREEAERFLQSPAEYDRWLHEKQAMDACYWPIVYGLPPDRQSAGGYTSFSPLEIPCIYMDKVPPEGFTTVEPGTGCRVPVSEWLITVEDGTEKICEIPYEEFRAKLPADRVSRYDEHMILIQPMTAEELRAIYSPESASI